MKSNNNDFFKFLKKLNYKIKKDNESNNIIYIHIGEKQIKCNYLLLFVEINNKLLWSCDNIFTDPKTQNITRVIKENLSKNNKSLLKNNKIYEIIKTIKNSKKEDLDNNKCEWILSKNIDENCVEYYMITDIIYF
jgi:hypothetical protein